jgi:predicted nucleic acid-binding protein
VASTTLVDSGPLAALFDAGDAHHREAVSWIATVKDALATTTASVTEVCFLLQAIPAARLDFLTWLTSGAVTVVDLEANDWLRIRELMEKYADLPMDLADAALVAVGERLGVKRIATFDSDFRIYRLRRNQAFTNVIGGSKR